MHDGDILAPDIIHHHLSDSCILTSIPEEQQVAALESWFHGSREDYHDGRGGISGYGQAFPEHECCAEDQGEV